MNAHRCRGLVVLFSVVTAISCVPAIARGEPDASAAKAYKSFCEQPADGRSFAGFFQAWLRTSSGGELESFLKAQATAAARSPQAGLHLAIFYETIGRREQALTALTRAAATDPTPASRLRLARFQILYGDRAAGIKLLAEMLADPQTPSDARVRLAQVLIGMGQSARAAELIGPTVTTQPEPTSASSDFGELSRAVEPRLSLLYAVALQESGQSAKAIEAALAVLDIRQPLPSPASPAVRRRTYDEDLFLDVLPPVARSYFRDRYSRGLVMSLRPDRELLDVQPNSGPRGETLETKFSWPPAPLPGLPDSEAVLHDTALSLLSVLAQPMSAEERTRLAARVTAKGIALPDPRPTTLPDRYTGPMFDPTVGFRRKVDDETLAAMTLFDPRGFGDSGLSDRQAFQTLVGKGYAEFAIIAAISRQRQAEDSSADPQTGGGPLVDEAINMAGQLKNPSPSFVAILATVFAREGSGSDALSDRLRPLLAAQMGRIDFTDPACAELLRRLALKFARGDDLGPLVALLRSADRVVTTRPDADRSNDSLFAIGQDYLNYVPGGVPAGLASGGLLKPDKIKPLLAGTPEPMVRLLLADGCGLDDQADAAAEAMVAPAKPPLHHLVLASWRQIRRGRFDRGAQLLERALPLTTRPDDRTWINGGILFCAMRDPQNEKLAAAGKSAVARLRACDLSPYQQGQLVEAMVALGQSAAAGEYVCTLPLDLVNSSNGITSKLMAGGQRDVVIDLLARQFAGYVRARMSLAAAPSGRWSDGVADMHNNQLTAPVLDKLKPADSAGAMERIIYAYALEMVRDAKSAGPDIALEHYRAALQTWPDHRFAAMHAAMLSADEQDAWGFLVQAVGQPGQPGRVGDLLAEMIEADTNLGRMIRLGELAVRAARAAGVGWAGGAATTQPADSDLAWAGRVLDRLTGPFQLSAESGYAQVPSVFEELTQENMQRLGAEVQKLPARREVCIKLASAMIKAGYRGSRAFYCKLQLVSKDDYSNEELAADAAALTLARPSKPGPQWIGYGRPDPPDDMLSPAETYLVIHAFRVHREKELDDVLSRNPVAAGAMRKLKSLCQAGSDGFLAAARAYLKDQPKPNPSGYYYFRENRLATVALVRGQLFAFAGDKRTSLTPLFLDGNRTRGYYGGNESSPVAAWARVLQQEGGTEATIEFLDQLAQRCDFAKQASTTQKDGDAGIPATAGREAATTKPEPSSSVAASPRPRVPASSSPRAGDIEAHLSLLHDMLRVKDLELAVLVHVSYWPVLFEDIPFGMRSSDVMHDSEIMTKLAQAGGNPEFLRRSAIVADVDRFDPCVMGPGGKNSLLESLVLHGVRDRNTGPWATAFKNNSGLAYAYPLDPPGRPNMPILPTLKQLPQTFGTALAITLIEEPSPQKVYGLLGGRLDDICRLPPKRQMDIIRAVAGLLKLANVPDAARPGGDATRYLAYANSLLQASDSDEADAFLRTTKINTRGASYMEGHEFLPKAARLIAGCVTSAPDKADRMFNHAMALTKAAGERSGPMWQHELSNSGDVQQDLVQGIILNGGGENLAVFAFASRKGRETTSGNVYRCVADAGAKLLAGLMNSESARLASELGRPVPRAEGLAAALAKIEAAFANGLMPGMPAGISTITADFGQDELRFVQTWLSDRSRTDSRATGGLSASAGNAETGTLADKPPVARPPSTAVEKQPPGDPAHKSRSMVEAALHVDLAVARRQAGERRNQAVAAMQSLPPDQRKPVSQESVPLPTGMVEFYQRELEDASIPPSWRLGAYSSLRILQRPKSNPAEDPWAKVADVDWTPLDGLALSAARLMLTPADSTGSAPRSGLVELLDTLNRLPTTAAWKELAGPLCDAVEQSLPKTVSDPSSSSGPGAARRDDYTMSPWLTCLQARLRLADRKGADRLLASKVVCLPRYPLTYMVLLESPWPDLVGQTLSAECKTIEPMPNLGYGDRLTERAAMTPSLRDKADAAIAAVKSPDVRHLAESLYAAFPARKQYVNNDGRTYTQTEPQEALAKAVEAFGQWTFTDPAVRIACVDYLLIDQRAWSKARPLLLIWGATQDAKEVLKQYTQTARYGEYLIAELEAGHPDVVRKAIAAIAPLTSVNDGRAYQFFQDFGQRFGNHLSGTVNYPGPVRPEPANWGCPMEDYLAIGKALEKITPNYYSSILIPPVFSLHLALGKEADGRAWVADILAGQGPQVEQYTSPNLGVFEMAFRSRPKGEHAVLLDRLDAALKLPNRYSNNVYKTLEDFLRDATPGYPAYPAIRQAMQARVAAENVELERKAAADPKNADLLKKLAERQILAGQTDSAVKSYRTLVALEPTDQSWRALARLLVSAGRVDEAASTCREMAAKWPKTASPAMADCISAWAAARQWDTLRKQAVAWQGDHPTDWLVISTAGTQLSTTQKDADSIPLYQRYLAAVRSDEERSQGLAALGGAYRRTDKLAEAADAYSQAAEVEPFRSHEVAEWRAIGEIREKLLQLDKAQSAYAKALALVDAKADSERRQLVTCWARVTAGLGKVDEAIAAYRSAMQTQAGGPDDVFARRVMQNELIQLFRQGRAWDQALAAVDEGLQMLKAQPTYSSDHVRTWPLLRATILFEAGRLAEALKAAEQLNANRDNARDSGSEVRALIKQIHEAMLKPSTTQPGATGKP